MNNGKGSSLSPEIKMNNVTMNYPIIMGKKALMHIKENISHPKKCLFLSTDRPLDSTL